MKHLATALSTLIFCAAASAQVTITDPWVRGTVPQQKASGLFMQIDAAQDVRLIGGSSPVAGIVEIHEMKMDGGVMRMSAISALPLPAGKIVELKPGGYHVMLMDLKQQVKVGDEVPLTLTIENKDGSRATVELRAPVRALNAPMKKMHH